MIKAKAIVFTAIGKVELTELEVSRPKSGQVLVRVEASAVSPGTELRCLAGLQPGSLPFPFVPGYSAVGIVKEAPEARELRVGDRVFVPGSRGCSIASQWGGHASVMVVDEAQALKVAASCDPKLAAMTKLVAIALRGSRIAKPTNSDTVAVVGLGPIGQLSARLFSLTTPNVLGLDTIPARVELAMRPPVNAVQVGESVATTVREHFKEGATIVVDATGSQKVLADSMRAARDLPWGQDGVTGSKLVIQGSYPGEFSLSYQEAFTKELCILLPRDVTPAELNESVRLIETGECPVADLVSWHGDPAHAEQAYRLLQEDRRAMTAVFDWSAYSQ